MTAAPAARITNVALGQLLGLDHSSASRLRRGQRGCSIEVMIRIEDLLGWPVRAQHTAFVAGTFSDELERRLIDWTATRRADYDTQTGS